MSSKLSSLEERVKLPQTETISRCYQPQQGNKKVIRILTVAVYVLCVSLAAIILSLYYILIWDPTIRPFVSKGSNCEKLVIPQKIAIRLLNSSEVTAEQFYKLILEQYRILNQMQQQRIKFLNTHHIKLQKLTATNKFQEIFATATIIQSNPNAPVRKLIIPENRTFLLESPIDAEQIPILQTSPTHVRRKAHRKHYYRRRNQKTKTKGMDEPHALSSSVTFYQQENSNFLNHKVLNEMETTNHDQLLTETYLDQPTSVIQEPPYSSMSIPLISSEEKNSIHQNRAIFNPKAITLSRKHTNAAKNSAYEKESNLNSFLNDELIFAKEKICFNLLVKLEKNR